MTSDNGQGVWGFIILIGLLWLFGWGFIKVVAWIIGIAIAFLIVVRVLDLCGAFKSSMPKDEDE